jgi:hypothetical protein
LVAMGFPMLPSPMNPIFMLCRPVLRRVRVGLRH